jgi:methanethiol S-methyltransferase
MTQVQFTNPAVSANRASKFIAFLYGLVAYFAFLITVI